MPITYVKLPLCYPGLREPADSRGAIEDHQADGEALQADARLDLQTEDGLLQVRRRRLERGPGEELS